VRHPARALLPALAVWLAVAAAAGTAVGTAAGATTWAVTVQAGSVGEGHARAIPTAPASPSAACTSSSAKTIKVSWSAVALATSYSVYDSTTSATGTYTLVASAVTATAWTSGTLTAGNYWYEVTALIGTNWASAKSAASAETTIGTASPKCTQP
jgi:hypothetical protein